MDSSQPRMAVSATRLAIEDIARQRERLENNQSLKSLIDLYPEPVAVLNEHRQIIYASPTFKGFHECGSVSPLGRRPGEALGCACAFLKPEGCGTTVHCQKCGALEAILECLEGRPNNRDCEILRRDGEALDLRIFTRPLAGDEEKLILFFMEDCSDEKRRSALERTFFHDVLDTATGMVGLSDLLRQTLPESGHAARLANAVYRLALNVMDEIHTQRVLAAAEGHELKTESSLMEALTVLREVALCYTDQPMAIRKTLRIDPDSRPVRLESDEILLKRIVSNMVRNALEASHCGDTVTMRCLEADGQACFEVHNPVPMPEDVQYHIFKRSFSTKGKGRGLGTYSLKLLGEKYLGGRVTFTSSEDAGTTFRFTLPAVSGAAAPRRRGEARVRG